MRFRNSGLLAILAAGIIAFTPFKTTNAREQEKTQEATFFVGHPKDNPAKNDIYVNSPDQSTRNLTRGRKGYKNLDIDSIAISEDGTVLICAEDLGANGRDILNFNIYNANYNGFELGPPVQLTSLPEFMDDPDYPFKGNESDVTFLPKSRYILFANVSGGGIWRATRDGKDWKRWKQLTTYDTDAYPFSLDGKEVFYYRLTEIDNGTLQYDIWTVRAMGGRSRNTTNTPNIDEVPDHVRSQSSYKDGIHAHGKTISVNLSNSK